MMSGGLSGSAPEDRSDDTEMELDYSNDVGMEDEEEYHFEKLLSYDAHQ
jgi:hypothetical protein